MELFDGVSTKDKEVMVLMTSNHVDALPKGMSRVGRIDASIEIGDLDRPGIERLISYKFAPEQLADDIDFDAICEAMLGYEPAFIMGTFNLTKSNAIVRTESGKFTLNTSDFVIAAETLRNQHDTHVNAADRPAVETVGKVVRDLVSSAVSDQLQNHMVDLEDGEILARV
jgi:ATP-dependent 26S proteasome regulatory subunit